MKLKALLLTLIGLVVLAGLLAMLARQDAATLQAGSLAIGDPVLEAEVLAEAQAMQIRSDTGQSVLLEKDGEGDWVLPEYYGAPVDFSRLARLTQQLQEAEVRDIAAETPAHIERLELGEYELDLIDESGEVVWSGSFGKTAPGGGGFFAVDSEVAYRVSQRPFVDTAQANWARKQVLDFPADEVASVTVYPESGDAVAVERDSATSPWAAQNEVPEGQEIDPAAIDRFLRSVLNARYSAIVDRELPDAARAIQERRDIATLTRFDGTSWTIALGRRPAERVEVTSTEGSETAELETQIAEALETAADEDPANTTSIIFDQDGNILTEEDVARIRAEMAEGVAEEATEEIEETVEASAEEAAGLAEPSPLFDAEQFAETTGIDLESLTQPDAGAEPEAEPVEMTDPGPLFLFYTNSEDRRWQAVQTRGALQFPDFLADQLTPEPSTFFRPASATESAEQP
jgi:hypothetical protein